MSCSSSPEETRALIHISRFFIGEYSLLVLFFVGFLDDKIGLGLEGIKCLTFRDLKGNFEKICEKTYGVRRETRFTEPRSVSELLALYQGGLPSFMVAQASYNVARSVERNTETLKYLYRNQLDLSRITQAVLEALWRLLDQLDSVK